MNYDQKPKTFMMRNYYPEAFHSLQKIIEMVNNRNVIKVNLANKSCQKTDPCRGHRGVIITFDTDETIYYKCSSVSCGAIMIYFYEVHSADIDRHCTEYIEPDFKEYLINTFSPNKNK